MQSNDPIRLKEKAKRMFNAFLSHDKKVFIYSRKCKDCDKIVKTEFKPRYRRIICDYTDENGIEWDIACLSVSSTSRILLGIQVNDVHKPIDTLVPYISVSVDQIMECYRVSREIMVMEVTDNRTSGLCSDCV